MDLYNKKVFYSMGTGYGIAKNELNAFDRAMIDSGCANYNLLKVSSILPPDAEYVTKICYAEGALLPTAFAKLICGPSEECKNISAAVAIGIPNDKSKVGVIMEWSGYSSEKEARNKVISMVEVAMSDRGILNFRTEVMCVEKETSKIDYTCVLAYVALMVDD